MSVSIIPTKIIIPKRPGGVLRRPRLTEYLHENLERKLMLVTAPAGYGKTTLLIDFAHDAEMPVCWYTLDEGDRDPTVFLAHLVASLQRHFPKFGQRTQPLVDSGIPAAPAAAAALVADMVSDIPEYFILVLDDWHLVSDEAPIRELIDQVLRYLPEHAHFIVAGRTLLRGPLIRLAAQGAVAGIGPADLRFTGEEVRAVLASRFNLSISAEQAERFAVEAEGWITAILLTSSSVWQDVLGRLAHVRDSAGTLYEYLASEVFDRLETALQDFLLASAVPRQFTAELCSELGTVGTAQDWIAQVEARNLFLIQVEDAGQRWYRYHHLFREFLLSRLQRQPARFAQVQRRAGEVFESRQQPEEAVEHYLAAGEVARAAHIMQAMARQLFINGRRQTLRAWFEQLPIQYHALAPELLLSQGQALLETGQASLATSILQAAEAGFQAQADRFGQIRSRLLQGWTYHARGKYSDGLQLGHGLLPDLNAVEEPLLTAEALRLIGANYYGRGDWTAAEQPLEQALALYRRAPADSRRAFSLGRTLEDLANVLRTTGRLEEAATLQAEALTLWRQIGNPGPLARCLNNLGYDRYVAGDYDGALALYAEALTRAEEAEDQHNRVYLLDGMAAAYRDRGDSDRAIGLYRQALNLASELGDQAIMSWLLTGLGHAYRLADDLERALALFEQARSLAEREGIHAHANHALASLGITRVEQGQIEAGLAELNQAEQALRQTDSYLDLGKMLLWQARAHYLRHDEVAAQRCLSEMVRLGHRLGCRPFALAEERRAEDVLAWGAGQVDDRMLRQWVSVTTLQTADTLPPLVTVSTVPQPRVEVRAFGAGQVARDGRVLSSTDWGGSALAREMVFYMLEQPPQRRDEIGVIFWPTLSSGRMTSSFHAAKYKARRALGVEFAIFEDDCYRINPAMNLWYDVAEFQRLLASATTRSASDPDRAAEFQQALNLYTGPYLADSYAEWPVRPRERLQIQFFELVKTLIDDLLARRQYADALVAAQRGLEQDYYREDLHLVVMRCLAEIGQSARALAHYDKMSRRLTKELGTRPNPDVRACAKQIRLAAQSAKPHPSGTAAL